MSLSHKALVASLLGSTFIVSGCQPRKGTANPEDYYPLIQVALAGGETAAMIGRNEAIKAENFGGCVAASVLTTAFDSANQALSGRLMDTLVVPGVSLDVSECLPLQSKEGKGNQDAAMLVDTLAGVTLAAASHYAAKLKVANCKKGTAALGAISYVGGMLKPIASEIENPDGKIEVPAVVIDLSECESGA